MNILFDILLFKDIGSSFHQTLALHKAFQGIEDSPEMAHSQSTTFTLHIMSPHISALESSFSLLRILQNHH